MSTVPLCDVRYLCVTFSLVLAAVLALSRTGRAGGPAVAAIADNHPNPAVRAFARLALGKAPKPY